MTQMTQPTKPTENGRRRTGAAQYTAQQEQDAAKGVPRTRLADTMLPTIRRQLLMLCWSGGDDMSVVKLVLLAIVVGLFGLFSQLRRRR